VKEVEIGRLCSIYEEEKCIGLYSFGRENHCGDPDIDGRIICNGVS
jgi:hypothetical protein